jgi:hypothetical protein
VERDVESGDRQLMDNNQGSSEEEAKRLDGGGTPIIFVSCWNMLRSVQSAQIIEPHLKVPPD